MNSNILKGHIEHCVKNGLNMKNTSALVHICSMALKENMGIFAPGCGGDIDEMHALSQHLLDAGLIDSRSAFIEGCYTHIRNYRVNETMRFAFNAKSIAESDMTEDNIKIAANIGLGILDLIGRPARIGAYQREILAALELRERALRKA